MSYLGRIHSIIPQLNGYCIRVYCNIHTILVITRRKYLVAFVLMERNCGKTRLPSHEGQIFHSRTVTPDARLGKMSQPVSEETDFLTAALSYKSRCMVLTHCFVSRSSVTNLKWSNWGPVKNTPLTFTISSCTKDGWWEEVEGADLRLVL